MDKKELMKELTLVSHDLRYHDWNFEDEKNWAEMVKVLHAAMKYIQEN